MPFEKGYTPWNKGLTGIGEGIGNASEKKVAACRKNLTKGRATQKKNCKYIAKYPAVYPSVKCIGHPKASNSSQHVHTHVLVAEKALGRYLASNEIVHHIDGDSGNYDNTNLLICDRSYHGWLHAEMSRRYQREHFR